MIRILGKLIPTGLMLSFIFGSSPAARASQTQSTVDDNAAFALDLYGQLKTSPGNLFFSPYSTSTCLAMTYAGARGETEKQMSRVLHLDKDQRKVHASFSELQRQLSEASNQKGIELSVANCLWAQKGHPFLPAFLEVAKAEYQANVNQADFITEAEVARGEVNRWVAQKTEDKIQNILPPGSLTGLTRLVLANAIYFKGVWAKPYDKAETSSQPFHLSTTRRTDVPLMHHFDNVRYMEDTDFQAVELPYQGGELSMVILLPRRADACGHLENRWVCHTPSAQNRTSPEWMGPNSCTFPAFSTKLGERLTKKAQKRQPQRPCRLRHEPLRSRLRRLPCSALIILLSSSSATRAPAASYFWGDWRTRPNDRCAVEIHILRLFEA